MSLPDRLWRVVKGHWALAEDRIEEITRGTEAEADAYRELAEAIRKPEPDPQDLPPALPSTSSPGGRSSISSRPAPPSGDPLAASYTLLGLEPGCDLAALDAAYEKQMLSLRPDQHPAGTPEREALEAKRSAVEAAYEKVRDCLNPTETRFERLEF